jgi:hypothetical protein
MPFMVIYSTSDGASCHEQADAIDEAALFVERLRNQDGIDDVRLYRMEEISFAFRPYYKVELGLPERLASDRSAATPPVVTPAAPVDSTEPAPTEAAPTEPPAADDASAEPLELAVGGEADSNGAHARRGLFGR